MPPPGFWLRWQAFHLVKGGNAPTDYEDAFAADEDRARFAIADGTSEASFAAEWARLLTEGFTAEDGRPWRDLDWLSPLRRRWAAEIDARPLPWYAEEKRTQGAFATLLGVVFRPPKLERPGGWWALAVGDSCLFHTRAGRMRASFPLTQSAEFGNQPALVGSRPGTGRPPELASGRWRPGDRFLLMTDALAQWFLQREEADGEPCGEVAALLAEADPTAAFPGWIGKRRREHGLRNDDVTLLVIDL